MKEITSTTMNIYYVKIDGKFEPQIEGILVVSEPVYKIDAAGQLVRERVTETIRFSTSAKVIKKIGAEFIKWADEAEKEVDNSAE